MMKKPTIINKKTIFKGNVLEFQEIELKLKDGVISKWDYIIHPGAVCVALYNEKNNKFIMVEQYRLATNNNTLEFCAGKIDKNESLISTLKREAQEETGWTIKDIEYFGSFYPSVAFMSEEIHLYYATVDQQKSTNFDIDEDIFLKELNLNEIEELILSNQIKDAKTIILFNFLKNKFNSMK